MGRTEKKVWVRLTHTHEDAGVRYAVGDVIELTQSQARWLADLGRCEIQGNAAAKPLTNTED